MNSLSGFACLYEKEFATTMEEESTFTQGQRHDRIPDPRNGGASKATVDPNNFPPEIDISAGQKMLSAVSGSLLTSFLGMI